MMVNTVLADRRHKAPSLSDSFSQLLRDVRNMRDDSAGILLGGGDAELQNISLDLNDLIGGLRCTVCSALTGDKRVPKDSKDLGPKLRLKLGRLSHESQFSIFETVADPHEKSELKKLLRSPEERERNDFYHRVSARVYAIIHDDAARSIFSSIEIVRRLAQIADVISELPEFADMLKSFEEIKDTAARLLRRVKNFSRKRKSAVDDTTAEAPVEELSVPERLRPMENFRFTRSSDDRFVLVVRDADPAGMAARELMRFARERQMEGLVELEMRLAADLLQLELEFGIFSRRLEPPPRLRSLRAEVEEVHDKKEAAEDDLRFWSPNNRLLQFQIEGSSSRSVDRTRDKPGD